MDVTVWQWIAATAIAAVCGLCGIVYGLLRAEDQRLSRNLHKVRNTVQAVIVTLATKGIIVRVDED